MEGATPRAQLHLRRVMGGFEEGVTGTGPPATSTTRRGSGNFTVSSSRLSSHSINARARPATFHRVQPSSNNNSGRIPGTNGRLTPPQTPSSALVGSHDVSSHNGETQPRDGRLEEILQDAPRRTQRVVGAPAGKPRPQCVLEKGPVAENGVSCLSSGSLTVVVKSGLHQVESEEARYRRFMEEIVFLCMEGLLCAKNYGKVCFKQLEEMTEMVTRVAWFLQNPAEKILQDPEGHMAQVGEVTWKDLPMNTKDVLLVLKNMPASIAAHYNSLMSTAREVSGVEEALSVISIPQTRPVPEQQQQRQHCINNSPTCEASLSSGPPSIFLPSCRNTEMSDFRLHQPVNGFINSRAAPLMSENLDSAEDLSFSLALAANTVMRRREHGGDTTLAVENLQEDNVYWQEEVKRVMSEAEGYVQMVHTLLDPPSAAPSEDGGGDPEQLQVSVTGMGLPTQRSFIQRQFLRLLQEKEEGARAMIKVREAQDWWQLWFTAKR